MKRILIVAFIAAALGGPVVRAQESFNVYFGLLHGHTSFSDGLGRPDQAYPKARQAGLDFLAITEHNHDKAGGSGARDDGIFLTPPLYEELKRAADAHTRAGEFVAIYGQEFSTISSGNHVNIFNASEICDVANGDFKDLYESWLPDHPEVPFIQFNHPGASEDRSASTAERERNNDYGIDDYDQSFAALVEATRGRVALIEMIIGPAFGDKTDKPHHHGRHEPDYLFYLNQGFRLGVSVGQDNHNENWGSSTHARLGVWARELTREGIFRALAARRSYASEDENIEVKFTANGRWMGGSVQPDAAGEVDLGISIKDPDEPNADYRIEVFYDDAIGGEKAKVIESTPARGDQTLLTLRHIPQLGGYYFLKVSQKSTAENPDDDVWTSPIWVGPGDGEEEEDREEGEGEEHSERDVIRWDEAHDYIGLEKTVTGTIVRTFNSGRAVFLNFDPDFKNTLNLVILAANFGNFGGAERIAEELMGKTVKVKGHITVFQDRNQILLESRDQILSVEP